VNRDPLWLNGNAVFYAYADEPAPTGDGSITEERAKMDGSFFSIGHWVRLPARFGIGRCGFYLMLPRRSRRASVAAAGVLAACAVSWRCCRVARRRSRLRPADVLADSGLTLFRQASARRGRCFGDWFGFTPVLAATRLLAIDSMWKPAGVCVVLAAVAGLVAWWKISRQGAEHSSLDDEAGREPLLVCFAAFLFSLMMNGVLREQPLRQEAVLFGGIVLSIGAIGFVTRRGWVAVLLSWGVMTQGALMTLCGLTRLHGSRGGESFLLAGLL
jgi:hypothetical protein